MNRADSLAKISKDLILKEPFYGFLLIMLNKIWDNKAVPTAGVSKNGINYQLAINEDFWQSLSELHKLGLIKHELLHIAFFHLTSYHTYPDRKLANIAMDMEINQYIDKTWLPGAEISIDDFNALKEAVRLELEQAKENNATLEELKAIADKLPPRGILIEDYADLNLDAKAGTRYYYDKLREAKDKKDKTGTSGDSEFDALCDQLDNNDDLGIPDHGSWGEFEELSEAEKKLMDNQTETLLKNAKEVTIKKRGTTPGELSDFFIGLETIVKAKFDWRGYIRRFTGTSTKVFTKKLRRKENIKFESSPGLKIKMKQHMLLAIDTSGSVCDDEVKEFMNEIHHIYKTGVDVTIIQCDVVIKSITQYKGKFDSMAIHGRGGTEFDPVLEYYNNNLKKYTSLIYFTDGECSTSVKPKAPILWVLSERSHMNDSLPGKVIKLEI
jgi:predicted metal-dependent peptidase